MCVIAVIGVGLSIWKENNPQRFCDEISDVKTPITCRLRYPILNKEEIKKAIDENEVLKEKNRELENKLDELKNVFEYGIEDNWQPEPMEIEY